MAPPSNNNKGQSKLDSFFGAAATGAASKKKDKQKKIESFFGAAKAKKQASPKEKENKADDDDAPLKAKRKTRDEDESAEDDGQELQQNESSASAPPAVVEQRQPKKKISKRRVIDDDSSDDDEEDELGAAAAAAAVEKKDVVMKDSSTDASSEVAMDDAEESKTEAPPEKESKAPALTTATKKSTVSAKKASKLAKKEAEKMETDEEGDDDGAPKETGKKPAAASSKKQAKKPSTSSALAKAANKGQYKSDEAILKEIVSTNWDADMPYVVLCQAFAKIEEVTSRLAIQEIMTTLFRQILLRSPSTDLGTVLYLASNSVAPAYDCVELGIGDSLLNKAIGQATGTSANMVKQKYETVGDLGTVAQTLKSKQKTLGGFFAVKTASKAKTFLTCTEILKTFRQIAETKGNQSQKWKVDHIQKMLVRATDPLETKYIIRGLQGKLRIGLAQSTVLISLAHALALSVPESVVETEGAAKEKSGDIDDYPVEAKNYMDKTLPVEKRLEAAVAIVKKAYSEVPSYDAILDAALKVPLQEFHKVCTLTPGIPVSPMLAKPTKSVQEVLKRLNGLKFTLEYKYDGERAQVHMLPDGTTKVFSRSLLDTSEKYPEVPSFVKEACKDVDSFVLDAEVVAFNRETGKLVPFQVLSTRKKTEESAETAKVQVIVQAFDLMYLNGESLLSRTLMERRELMRKHFQPVEGKFQFATSLDHQEDGDTTLMEEFLDSAVKGQCEGLMVKTLEVNAIYEPSRRSLNWLKLKKDYLEDLGDTVDLVPIGAYHGRGKRTGTYGSYLLACYDPDTEEFQSVCKTGTGFSDDALATLRDGLNNHKIPSKSTQYNVTDQLECDVWFDAVQVWEVGAADLSKSSTHRGAVGKTGEAGRGIGLRFPRFKRLRDDKRPEDATTSDQILEMYYQQDAIVGGDNDNDDDEDGI